jgi:Asp-tRNA(Asn)/Glu-tRNA(Gln) amidotransferase A subunit family amidase
MGQRHQTNRHKWLQNPLVGKGGTTIFKDIIATADIPTEYGSPIYSQHRLATA